MIPPPDPETTPATPAAAVDGAPETGADSIAAAVAPSAAPSAQATFGGLPLPSLAHLNLEREQMAWPPAGWEEPEPTWRADLRHGTEGGLPSFGMVGAGEAAFPAPEAWPGLPAELPQTGHRGWRLLREVAETVFLALVIFLGIRLFVLQFKIEGTSMAPTLADGEYILVNRLAYRLFGEPRRGDIVVFESPNPDKDYIKRVIGLPGQRVEVRNMEVFIDGQRLDEAYLAPTTTTGESSVILGPDEYFVMGDNRDNSQDSRAIGPVKAEKIIGKAWLIYWPPPAMGRVPDADQERPIETLPGAG